MAFRKLFGGLALASVLATGAAHAAVVDWTLQDVFLSDGSAVTGTFDYDADANVYSDIAISVAGGPSYPNPSSFVDSMPVNGGAVQPIWLQVVNGPFTGNATGQEYLFLVFTSDLTDTGGKVAISSDFGSPQLGTCGNAACTILKPGTPEVFGGERQGFVTTEATTGVPEPAAWALMLMGFGGLGAVLRRRRSFAHT